MPRGCDVTGHLAAGLKVSAESVIVTKRFGDLAFTELKVLSASSSFSGMAPHFLGQHV